MLSRNSTDHCPAMQGCRRQLVESVCGRAGRLFWMDAKPILIRQELSDMMVPISSNFSENYGTLNDLVPFNVMSPFGNLYNQSAVGEVHNIVDVLP